MKLTKDGKEIEIGNDIMNFFLDSSANIITDGLLSKFVETSGIPIGGKSIVPVAKEYCMVGKFISDTEDHKTSFDAITKILDSDTPYIDFNKNINQIKIIDPKVRDEWKNLIDQQIFNRALQETMFN